MRFGKPGTGETLEWKTKQRQITFGQWHDRDIENIRLMKHQRSLSNSRTASIDNIVGHVAPEDTPTERVRVA
jgi:hypothetical protein